MFHYETLFPPQAQLEIRRNHLDHAGFQAWLSAVILLLTIYLGRLLLARSPSSNNRDSSQDSTTTQTVYRRVKRTLNKTYVPEFGPLQVQVAGSFYLSWLLFLIFRNTGNDYLHLTKAFGHVAVSQLPLHYLLAFQNPRSPIVLATGLTYKQLNAYHRLSGRILHVLLGTHAILYINFFVVKDMLAKRIQHRDVRLGITAFWLVNLLALLALPVVRRKARRLFYRSHVAISAALTIVLFFHVPYTRRYVVQAGVFWFANGYLKSKTV